MSDVELKNNIDQYILVMYRFCKTFKSALL